MIGHNAVPANAHTEPFASFRQHPLDEVNAAKRRMIDGAIFAQDSLQTAARIFGAALVTGRTVDEVGREIFEEILAVAGGKKTKSEQHGIGDEEFIRRVKQMGIEEVRDDGKVLGDSLFNASRILPNDRWGYDISDPADWSPLGFVYQALFDPWRELDVDKRLE